MGYLNRTYELSLEYVEPIEEDTTSLETNEPVNDFSGIVDLVKAKDETIKALQLQNKELESRFNSYSDSSNGFDIRF